MLERICFPPSTTAAAVSSQEVSIPKTFTMSFYHLPLTVGNGQCYYDLDVE